MSGHRTEADYIAQICALADKNAELVEALSLAYSFSKYSAAIHCFERRTPTQEWFDEHAKLIEDLQQKLEAAIAKGEA